MQIGDKLGKFLIRDQHENGWSNEDIAKKNVVIYFYPKDNTPGCSVEAREFTKLYNKFAECGYVVVGVSRDSVASHQKFSQKFDLPFSLLADVDSVLCNLTGVLQDKSMFGKKYKGIVRTTLVIQAGVLVKKWDKVKADGHAAEVLSYLQQQD